MTETKFRSRNAQNIFWRDTAGNHDRERLAFLARSGRQSERRICFKQLITWRDTFTCHHAVKLRILKMVHYFSFLESWTVSHKKSLKYKQTSGFASTKLVQLRTWDIHHCLNAVKRTRKKAYFNPARLTAACLLQCTWVRTWIIINYQRFWISKPVLVLFSSLPRVYFNAWDEWISKRNVCHPELEKIGL